MSAAYDQRALQVAQAVCRATTSEMVILFGSRARGDYRPESDIDLLILTDSSPDRDFHDRASRAAFLAMDRLYAPPVDVELVPMCLRDFHRARVSPNHVAGQAYRDGVTMNGDPPPYPPQAADNWPDIQQRFTAAWRNLRGLEINIAGDSPQEIIGFLAQQAVENVLKAWVSALGDEYRNVHSIASLTQIVRQHASEDNTDAGEALSWLTQYAVQYRYEGAKVSMDDPTGLLEAVTELCHAVRNRVIELTGRNDVPDSW